MSYKILTINPGSTSTKIAIYHDTTEMFNQNISHSSAELKSFSTITDQFQYRLEPIISFLEKQQLSLQNFSAIVGRGGLLKPMTSGTYLINETMLTHLKSGCYGSHASNLGAILANYLSQKANCPGFIVDPVVVDELDPICRITGRPELPKKSIFHALNHKAVGKRFAKSINRPYHELNLIIAHLGGGISIGCHKQGQVVEVNNALNGEGPFSPERAGTMQAGQFADFITQNNYSAAEISAMLSGMGGLVAHLGLNDVRQVQDLIGQGNRNANLVYEAMIYNISRYIAAAAVPVCGKIDTIILTGGIAHSTYITNKIKDYIGFIAPVVVIPGENELQALAEGAFRILSGEEKAKIYV
jgi:butyrate kinase